jgi:hypothetical protein
MLNFLKLEILAVFIPYIQSYTPPNITNRAKMLGCHDSILSKLTIRTTIFEIVEIIVEEGVDIGFEIKDLMLINQVL